MLVSFLVANAAVKWLAKERSGFASPPSTACYVLFPHYLGSIITFTFISESLSFKSFSSPTGLVILPFGS